MLYLLSILAVSIFCRKHDQCYGTCESSKYSRDVQFVDDLKYACGSLVNYFFHDIAFAYYLTVKYLAAEVYDRAWEDVCCG